MYDVNKVFMTKLERIIENQTLKEKIEEQSKKIDMLEKQLAQFCNKKCNIGERYKCLFYRYYSEDLCENWCNAYNDYCSVCYNLECLHYKDKGVG